MTQLAWSHNTGNEKLTYDKKLVKGRKMKINHEKQNGYPLMLEGMIKVTKMVENDYDSLA